MHRQLHAGQRWNLHKSRITLLLWQFTLLLDSSLLVASHSNNIVLPRPHSLTSDYVKEKETSREGRDVFIHL